jgi:hypothetical protein
METFFAAHFEDVFVGRLGTPQKMFFDLSIYCYHQQYLF